MAVPRGLEPPSRGLPLIWWPTRQPSRFGSYYVNVIIPLASRLTTKEGAISNYKLQTVFKTMRRTAVVFWLLMLGAGTNGAMAQSTKSTRTNVCKAGFCGDVTTEKSTRPQQVFTTLVLRSAPDGDRLNLRCPNGQQVWAWTLMCAGRQVSAQVCRKSMFGRSRCDPWVVFQ